MKKMNNYLLSFSVQHLVFVIELGLLDRIPLVVKTVEVGFCQQINSLQWKSSESGPLHPPHLASKDLKLAMHVYARWCCDCVLTVVTYEGNGLKFMMILFQSASQSAFLGHF